LSQKSHKVDGKRKPRGRNSILRPDEMMNSNVAVSLGTESCGPQVNTGIGGEKKLLLSLSLFKLKEKQVQGGLQMSSIL
jgi:hypothetical protein